MVFFFQMVLLHLSVLRIIILLKIWNNVVKKNTIKLVKILQRYHSTLFSKINWRYPRRNNNYVQWWEYNWSIRRNWITSLQRVRKFQVLGCIQKIFYMIIKRLFKATCKKKEISREWTCGAVVPVYKRDYRDRACIYGYWYNFER